LNTALASVEIDRPCCGVQSTPMSWNSPPLIAAVMLPVSEPSA